MLAIPSGKDLTVTASDSDEKYLMDVSRKWLEKDERSDGIHASALLDPMLAWHKAKDKNRKLTDREVTTFLIGKILHAFIISAVDGETGTAWDSDTGSKASKTLGIQYSMDYLCKDGTPAEIKTSRSFYPPKGIKDLAMYIEQLLVYMVAENKCTGKLWILYLNIKDEVNRTCPQFRAYSVTVTPKALADYKQQIIKTRKQLEAALKKKVPGNLPQCRDWLCTERMCSYWKVCPKGEQLKKGLQHAG